ncbi:hypothetical protein ABZS63_36075, partial [Streptomyces sp. NPDC005568]
MQPIPERPSSARAEAPAASHDREIESLAEFDEVVAARGSLAGFRVQAVDPRSRGCSEWWRSRRYDPTCPSRQPLPCPCPR